ncbi:GGDEF domain-containing protein [Methylophaga sp.]|uniref:GGDEF domain-containing protein n=1 Tax=Methylophaga sp. TaxID=2024840 RepID=UPI0027266245|nr:GGDEF domain-containing protein [Methylophaga sp.]MDO8825662.1 diguanylate cyclase [Methylophaga sp.]
MAADELENKLEQWKQKYLELLARDEKQTVYTQLLERSLGRLALVSEGIDTALDKQLQLLRQELRSRKDAEQISEILGKIQQCISKIDERPHASDGSELLRHLLLSLSIPTDSQSSVDNLLIQLKDASNQQARELLPDLVNLLEKMFSNKFVPLVTTDKPRSGILQKLGLSKLNTEIAQLLCGLIDNLQLPELFNEQLRAIREQLQSPNKKNLPQIVDALANLINSLGAQAQLQQLEYRAFLSTLSERINELDDLLRITVKDDEEAFNQRQLIGERVDAGLDDIRKQIDVTSEPRELKSIIRERLSALSGAVDEYRNVDQNRYLQSQLEIKKLTDRLQELESETKSLQDGIRKAHEMVRKDPLTGINNRQALMDTLETEYIRWQRYKHPLSIVVWDIDNFKQINDSLGHLAGDKILTKIAEILVNSTRGIDFVARYGGEEFVGIFPATAVPETMILANKIREEISNARFVYDGNPVPITVSAGIATFHAGDNTEMVFNRADQALLKAKQQGRNLCVADDQ